MTSFISVLQITTELYQYYKTCCVALNIKYEYNKNYGFMLDHLDPRDVYTGEMEAVASNLRQGGDKIRPSA